MVHGIYAKIRHIPQVNVAREDFRNISLRDADVIFLYLWPETNAALCHKLTQELKPGSRIISNTFPIQGLTPEKIEDNVYRYKI